MESSAGKARVGSNRVSRKRFAEITMSNVLRLINLNRADSVYNGYNGNVIGVVILTLLDFGVFV